MLAGGCDPVDLTAMPSGFSLPPGTPPAVVTAIAWALAQLGTPYSYGGDCTNAHGGDPAHQAESSVTTHPLIATETVSSAVMRCWSSCMRVQSPGAPELLTGTGSAFSSMLGPYLPTSIKRQARMPAQPSRWRVLLYRRSHVALLLPLRSVRGYPGGALPPAHDRLR
ncbi:MAG: hypothetical protein V7603_6661 [Micromonosporaceae bacterium]